MDNDSFRTDMPHLVEFNAFLEELNRNPIAALLSFAGLCSTIYWEKPSPRS
jgi:hypothetical protein